MMGLGATLQSWHLPLGKSISSNLTLSSLNVSNGCSSRFTMAVIRKDEWNLPLEYDKLFVPLLLLPIPR